MFANARIKRKARQMYELRRKQNPCTTRGLSFTDFPRNTMGKGPDSLTRVGCPVKVESTVDYDDVQAFIDYKQAQS